MIHDMIGQAAYMAHGYCLLWKPWLVGLHAGSDLLIALSYFAIPVAIWIFVRRRPNIELRNLAIMFALFIFLCGLTHIINLVTLWFPIYETQGWVKGVTAAVSVVTAIAIFPLIPQALAIPSPQELLISNTRLEQEIDAHRRTLAALERAKDELEARVAERTNELEALSSRFKAVFENAPVAIVICDKDGEITQANQAAGRLFMLEPGEVPGRKFETLVPASRAMVTGAVTAPADTGEAVPHADSSAIRSDGVSVPIELGLNAVDLGSSRIVVATMVDLAERIQREEQIKLLMREVNHRSKNMLGVVQSIARHTLASNPEDYRERFFARIRALSASHDLLIRNDWRGVKFADLLRSQLGHFEDLIGVRILLTGPLLYLQAAAAQTIGMALHELVTNATKYGALSNETGTISITWVLTGDQKTGRLSIGWRESGGPPCVVPDQRGFGITMIETMVKWGLSAEVDLSFDEAGLQWHLDCPADRAVDGMAAWI